jgi:glycerophosphoryl diester phosphodiesterase
VEGLMIATFLIVLTMVQTASAKISEKKLEIQGHRGARWTRPENTLPAFQYALENGVSTLELDMHVTKDNVIVVTHDPYISEDVCLDPNAQRIHDRILVKSLTLEELRKYDCGSLVNPHFPTQTPVPKTSMPTLEEVFGLVENSKLPNAKTIKFNIETKSEEAHPEFTPAPEPFVRMVLATVKKHKMLNRVELQSFDYRTLKIAKKLEPNLKLSLLIEDRPKEQNGLLQLVRQYGVQILSPNYQWLTEQDVQDMHKIGVTVLPWTPNTLEDWRKLIGMGVDGIITDNPKALIDFVKEEEK